MKKLTKLKLHDVRVLSNSEMRDIKGESSHPVDWKAYGDCMAKCINEVTEESGWGSVILYGVALYSGVAIPVGTTILGLCLIACEEYGPHIYY